MSSVSISTVQLDFDHEAALLASAQMGRRRLEREIARQGRLHPLNLGKQIRSARNIRAAKSQIAAAECKLTNDGSWPRIAEHIIDDLVAAIRREQSKRHPYHHEILADIDELVAQVVNLGLGADIRCQARMPVAVTDLPQLTDLLTPPSVHSTIKQRVHHYAAIAADPTMIHAWADGRLWAQDSQGLVLFVQHEASGLRATFEQGRVITGDKRPGYIYSKSYKIQSLDPRRPGVMDNWNSFVGLGIGAKLYLAGAALLPDERWASGTASPQALGLRRRLHLVDPYRWESPDCQWCDTNGIDWWTAQATEFDTHIPDP